MKVLYGFIIVGIKRLKTSALPLLCMFFIRIRKWFVSIHSIKDFMATTRMMRLKLKQRSMTGKEAYLNFKCESFCFSG
jgi:hypothetical protein